MRLGVEFADAWLKRGDEDRPEVDRMRLKAEVLVPKSASKEGSSPVLRVEIPSARIPDFSFFSSYLPPGAPVKLLSGVGNLTGELKLGTQSARGELLVKADDLRVGWDKLELTGNLTGVLELQGDKRHFDLIGARLHKARNMLFRLLYHQDFER